MEDLFMKLKEIQSLFKANNCNRILIKFLSPNDNSKNQIYLGGEEALYLFPSVNSTLQKQYSKKKNADEFIFHCLLDFYWLDATGLFKVPQAQIIFYPQYPESRFSGFLKGCKQAPRELLANRLENRILFLSSNSEKKSFGFVVQGSTALKNEIINHTVPFGRGDIFYYLEEDFSPTDPIFEISNAISRISKIGWIQSCKLSKDKICHPYKARNGGGYTLEAQLGITPNGDAEPDYKGWEVKQHSVKSKIITLLTPEPDAGFYSEKGVAEFIKKYGYPDKNGIKGRLNFGGIYKNGAPPHKDTKLSLRLVGFSHGKINDENGFIGLFNIKNEPVACWTFPKLLEHWSKKHARACYVPSEMKEENKIYLYRYLPRISLGIGTTFVKFLTCIETQKIYLDPAGKIILNTEKKQEQKARCQFRIHLKNLKELYSHFDEYLLGD